MPVSPLVTTDISRPVGKRFQHLQRNRLCAQVPALGPTVRFLPHVHPVTFPLSLLPGRPAPRTSPRSVPGESPARALGAHLATPLQDRDPRPGRAGGLGAASFALVNVTRVRCIRAATSRASASGPVQEGAGPQE